MSARLRLFPCLAYHFGGGSETKMSFWAEHFQLNYNLLQLHPLTVLSGNKRLALMPRYNYWIAVHPTIRLWSLIVCKYIEEHRLSMTGTRIVQEFGKFCYGWYTVTVKILAYYCFLLGILLTILDKKNIKLSQNGNLRLSYRSWPYFKMG